MYIKDMEHTTYSPMIQPSTLFLARLQGWGHEDGTAKVRVHVALATEGEYIFVAPGSSQQGHRPHQVVVKRDTENNLIKDTAFVLNLNDCRWVHTSDALRTTGRVNDQTFSQMWDQVEAQQAA